MKVGARYLGGNGCLFRLWAPFVQTAEVRIVAPEPRRILMDKGAFGNWEASADRVPPGALYLFVLDSTSEYPDPASRSQPAGVHGASEVFDPAFPWTDWEWNAPPLRDWIIYEIHIGTFTPEGTLHAASERLAELKDIGINAVEIMPVNQFPGNRNWGYDGAYTYAVQNSYGGPRAMQDFVDAAHSGGMAVILDVVYNHFGPEGSYFSCFGPYQTDKYCTPWGNAINFDGEHSDQVRIIFMKTPMNG